ncbi:MAG: hypothetical protein QOJ11_2464 [Frankiales bacterium]|jgi:hypothetical protein|nr:hypothetical protein [Frankiales bacterium]
MSTGNELAPIGLIQGSRHKTPAGRRRRSYLLTLATALAVGAGALGLRWLVSDHALYGYGSSESGPVTLGQTVYAGLPAMPTGVGAGESRRLDLRSVHLRIGANTSHATVTAMICSQRVGSASLVGGGEALGDPNQFCTSLQPFRAGSLTVGATASGIVVAVTPHTAGVVHIEGADVEYRDGIRRGRQHVGLEMTFTTAP